MRSTCQWPEVVWQQDAELIGEAGDDPVSVGIFLWALIEPEEGRLEFGWLGPPLELLHANGIRVDLGTPAVSPPAWFFHTYPEARVVSREGTVLGFGSRGMAGPSSPAYCEAAVRITTALAERYRRHPAFALWHVHNEYGVPVSEDYSPASAAAFRPWLAARYGDLEQLNTAWGTTFWGQRYAQWDLTASETRPEIGLALAADLTRSLAGDVRGS